MKKLNQLLLAAGVAVLLSAGASSVSAQGRGGGGFDPEQMKQRMLEFYKTQLEVTNDDEWKVISERIEAVTTAQRDARAGGGMGGAFGGRGGGRGAGGGGAGGGDTANQQRNPFAGEPNQAVDDLKKAIEEKASAEDIKAKLAKARTAIKEREDKVTKAQAKLKEVLSVRQEAIAVTMGLLK